MDMVTDEKDEGLLRAAVAAVPEDGKANRLLVQFLAKQGRVAKSTLKRVPGAKAD